MKILVLLDAHFPAFPPKVDQQKEVEDLVLNLIDISNLQKFNDHWENFKIKHSSKLFINSPIEMVLFLPRN